MNRSVLEQRNNLLAREAGSKGIVLLENSGVLPLKPCSIALYGNGARRTVKGGIGSGDVNERELVTVEVALEKSGFKVMTKTWLDAYDEVFETDQEEWKEWIFRIGSSNDKGIVRTYLETVHLWPEPCPIEEEHIPPNVEVALYVIARRCGEGCDRVLDKGDYYLYKEEENHIQLLQKHFDKVIVALNVGGVMDTKFYEEVAEKGALVLMGQPGQCAGDALVDVLTAKQIPSGKLTATWAKNYEDYPVCEYDRYEDGRRKVVYSQGIYVGYRYFDTYHKEVSYPFGYGLSYTTFTYSDLAIQMTDKGLKVTVSVQNTGKFWHGEEVVQIYALPPKGTIKKSKKVLIGFVKTQRLGIGEKVTLSTVVSLQNIASYSEEKMRFVLEEGVYKIQVGPHSRQLQEAGVLEVPFDRCLQSVEERQEEKEEPKYQQVVDSLTEDQLIDLVVGHTHRQEEIVGSASTLVPGAAGETTPRVEGVPIIVMADGPSGLRLVQHFQTDRDGKLLEIGVMAGLENGRFTPKVSHGVLDALDHYQYCTCFPIGTTLGQSWDESLIRRVGEGVAEEMRHFGIQLWLAPGMNIQLEPLCGRNYEYYSEDPLLTGKMATAMVQGVQSKPGTGAVIKHFACNNYEDGRLGGNSIVENQALEEIYLRGFEIAVKESAPAGIMTAYNFLNGVHCANARNLCTDIARHRWHYKGVIMTDWGATELGAKAEQCILAGNDLIMPGSDEDKREIKMALAEGRLAYKQLQACAKRVIRACIRFTQ